VLVRDPYTWVLARTRFFLSDTFQGRMEHLKKGEATIEDIMNMMIFGIYEKAPPMQDIFVNNAVAWLGTGARILKMEELITAVTDLDSTASEKYFADVLGHCGIDPLPHDWRERVRVGSDRKQSGTARENLVGLATEVPDELPPMQKKLVDFAIPGIREILGYQ
jgi:hypothetical protein